MTRSYSAPTWRGLRISAAARQEEKIFHHRVVHGSMRPLAESLKDEFHAQQAAIGIAVGVYMAGEKNVFALADEIDQTDWDGIVHSLVFRVWGL